MKSSLSRPAVVAVVSGALIAGSAFAGSPAYAGPGAGDAPTAKNTQSATEQSVTGQSVTGQSATPLDAAGLAVPDLSTTDPATPDPATTEPGAADPDTTVPTGSFRLNFTSVWTGQKVVFAQGPTEFKDEFDAPETLSRVVDWGDGTSTVLSPTTYETAKSYSRAGNFKVTVTITDPAGNVSAIPSKTVAVTVPAGKASLSRKSAYQGVPFKVNIGKVPAGATKYRIDWSDGIVSPHKASTKAVTGRILYKFKWDDAQQTYVSVGKLSGVRTLKIAWGNDAKGYSAWQTIGNINIVKDSWKPSLTIKKPSSPSRAASWKTIQGTVSDKGSGIRHLGVTAFRVTSTGKTYCLTANRKWKRYYTEADVDKYCYATGVKVKIVKGKWTLKLPAGLAKNQFFAVEAWTYDYANNVRSTYRTAKITRN